MSDIEEGFHRHVNGGGLVADTATVADTAFVGASATVYGNAEIYGNARVYDKAVVYGNAKVSGNVRVYGDVRVYGAAKILGDAEVFGNAEVSGDAVVSELFTSINRSDGYTFVYLPCSDGVHRIIAGCRYFTIEEAREHWESTRGGTPLGDETFIILDSLAAIAGVLE